MSAKGFVRLTLFSTLLLPGLAGCSNGMQFVQANKLFSTMPWTGGVPSGQSEPEVVVGDRLQSEDDIQPEQTGFDGRIL